jgi:alpha-L-fucosidase
MRRRDVLAGAGMLALPAALRGESLHHGLPITFDPEASPEDLAKALQDQYRVPDWYRDAKLGLWAHWGPQCAPEAGDWYGRHLYLDDNPQAEIHRKLYGHPADYGFIDVIAGWKAEKWDPDAIVSAYKRAGARFIVAMACHHDNFDLYPSGHEWNSTRLGPGRDIVGGWERAVRAAGLRFGVSSHASHAWHWWQTAYGYDTAGPRKGERYDAFRLTARDGRGKPWKGLDPQRLYTGRWMVPPEGLDSPQAMRQWHDANSGQWVETSPSGPEGRLYTAAWLSRQLRLIDLYQPDFFYQDGYSLPFDPMGRFMADHFYSHAIARTGEFAGVMSAGFTEGQGTIPNLERKSADAIRPEPWQSATCIGDWHYNRGRFTDRSYVPAAGVIRILADVVSKNGTLLLSIPVRGDGTLDGQELKILEDLGRWMAREGEAAIYGSRPWRNFGDDVQGGVRYTVSKGTLHALLLEPQAGTMRLAHLGRDASGGASVEKLTLIGGGEIPFRQNGEALEFGLTSEQAGATVPVLAIDGTGLTA